ncbi:MAG: hypothetical protein J5887_04720 [Erysipelotrichaceae bacterium]|nr:hypothetical protein [Erysipelotrichaceae bacterium]
MNTIRRLILIIISAGMLTGCSLLPHKDKSPPVITVYENSLRFSLNEKVCLYDYFSVSDESQYFLHIGEFTTAQTGEFEVEIRATDMAGNTSRAVLFITVTDE